MGPRKDVLTHDEARSEERQILVEPLLGIGLVLVNLFINDPEQEREESSRLIKMHR